MVRQTLNLSDDRVLTLNSTGKTFSWAKNVDTTFAIDTIRYYAGWADKIHGQVQEVGTIESF